MGLSTPNEPDFGGRIGRTYRDSTPWWPDPPSGLGGPNVVMIVLDDTGFAHFSLPFLDGTSRFVTGQFVPFAGGWA